MGPAAKLAGDQGEEKPAVSAHMLFVSLLLCAGPVFGPHIPAALYMPIDCWEARSGDVYPGPLEGESGSLPANIGVPAVPSTRQRVPFSSSASARGLDLVHSFGTDPDRVEMLEACLLHGSPAQRLSSNSDEFSFSLLLCDFVWWWAFAQNKSLQINVREMLHKIVLNRSSAVGVQVGLLFLSIHPQENPQDTPGQVHIFVL